MGSDRRFPEDIFTVTESLGGGGRIFLNLRFEEEKGGGELGVY